MEDPPRISAPYISIFISYFEYVVGHDFTYVMSKGKKKMEIYGSDIRGGSSMKGGSLNGWKLPSMDACTSRNSGPIMNPKTLNPKTLNPKP
jgi:hypothetical protein